MIDMLDLHISSIDWFFDCPRRFAYGHKQIYNKLDMRGVSALAGVGLHKGVEYELEPAKEEPGKLNPYKDTEEIAVQEFSDQFENTPWMRPPELQGKKKGDIKNEGEERVRRAIEAHYTDAAPSIATDVQHLERKLTMIIKDSKIVALPVKLHGRIDIEGKKVIRDTKLRGQTPSDPGKLRALGIANEAERSAQLTGYWLYRKLEAEFNHQTRPDRVILDVVVPLKTKVNYVAIPAKKTETDLKRFYQMLFHITSMIKAGLFPMNPQSNFCSDNNCVWHLTGVCPMGSHAGTSRYKESD